MNLNDVIELDQQYYMNTFGKRTPVCFDHGNGINLYDTEGREFKDFFAGIAVSSLGHAHPMLVEAISSQAAKLIHCSNLYYNEPQVRLAKLIVDNSAADKVFFANSGAEANEGAIKLARAYFKKHGFPDKYEIITLKDSFHGRTITTVTATGQTKYQKLFTPLTPGFIYVDRNDIDGLSSAITENTCAIMIEVIQGESGVYPLNHDYVDFVRRICDEKNILLIVDEVQTGIGRTGKLFGYENYGIEPDIFTLAKGIAGGFPMGVVCAKDFVSRGFEPGDHGTTFGGGPLACAASIATLETILSDQLVINSCETGHYFITRLNALSKKHSVISEIRGLGLMIGIHFSENIAVEIKNRLFSDGFLVGSVGANIVRILPPLIISESDVDEFICALDYILCNTIAKVLEV